MEKAEQVDACAISDAISRALAKVSVLEDDDVILLVDGLTLWLHEGASLEQAFGLSGTWRSYVARRRQQDALGEILRHNPGSSRRAQAVAIERLLREYQRAAFDRDRHAGHRPEGMKGLLYDYLLANGPLDFESLRKFAAGETPRLR